jgi:zinc transport system permease protein
MLDDFLVRAALAGIGLALAAGPLGSFVVWRRMAYFCDAVSHAAFLGVALALATALPVVAGTLAAALAMGLAVAALAARGQTTDAALGVLAHSALAFGLVAVTFIPGVRVDLQALLFGDILAVTRGDLAVIWGGAVLVAALIGWRWQRMVTATLSADLAQSSGIDPKREELILTLALAVTVAVALKVVGALLITAMLIVPAAAARSFARTPEAMAGSAVAIGALAAVGGLAASYRLDTPAGPSIVLGAVALLAAGNVARAMAGR